MNVKQMNENAGLEHYRDANGEYENDLINDMMNTVDDNPDKFTNVMGVMAIRTLDGGVGSMTIRTLDGDVINVIIIVQPIINGVDGIPNAT